jgi:hypothetical protein
LAPDFFFFFTSCQSLPTGVDDPIRSSVDHS